MKCDITGDGKESCNKMKLTCLLKLGALIIFVFHIFVGLLALYDMPAADLSNIISVIGFQFMGAVFEPLVLLALAKIIDYKEVEINYETKESKKC